MAWFNELSPIIKGDNLWNTWLWDSLYSSLSVFFPRGKAEGVKSLLDLSIIVCRTSSGTLSPRPLSLVCHSRRQVKSDVSCNGILEEGTYMISKQFVYRLRATLVPLQSWKVTVKENCDIIQGKFEAESFWFSGKLRRRESGYKHLQIIYFLSMRPKLHIVWLFLLFDLFQ